MTFSDVFAAVILANMLFMTVIYGMWRVSKDEKDIKAMLLIIGCCLIAAFIGLGGWLFD